MSSYYYQAYENPLKTIMGLAGLTIDAICNQESSKQFVKEVWKVHMQIVRRMENDRIAADKKRDDNFLESWHRSLSETEYFRKDGPRGAMMSIREEVERFLR